MLRIALAPCSPFSVTGELLAARPTWPASTAYGCTPTSARRSTRRTTAGSTSASTPVEYMESVGWLGPDVWYAHAVHLDDASIAKMAATGTAAAHCPSSNARLGSGIARARDMREAGIAVGLGVDGAASNEYCALWEELRHAVLFARARGGPQALTVRDAVDLATMGGARVLGRQDEIGSLEVGKLADVAVWRLDTLAAHRRRRPGGRAGARRSAAAGAAAGQRGPGHRAETSCSPSTRSPWPRKSTRPARPSSPGPRGPDDAARAVLPSLTMAAQSSVRTIGVRALPLTPGTPGLTDEDLEAIDRRLAADDAAREQAYPGTATTRQPVHTVYVPADQFHVEVAEEWGAAAAAALSRYAPRPDDMARITGLDVDAVRAVWPAVREKLRREPIEDLRIDLEDGYGTRPDDEEDRHAAMVGLELAAAVSTGSAPPFLGIRCKSLEPATRRRGLRTLDLVLRTLLEGAELPAGWVITLPKVSSVAQVTTMVDICERLERAYGLAEGALRFEIQVETPQAVLLADGTAAVAAMVHAAAGRCTGLHFGTYDYTAGLGIAGGYQSLDHPAADHAKAVMQLAAAGTGVWVSDGSTNQLPVGDAGRRTRRPGRCTPGWSGGRWSAASTRAGTCTRPSW